MNALKFEEAVFDLVSEQFDAAEFPFRLVRSAT